MSGRINKIELIDLAIASRVVQCDALRLDRNAALALKIHRVEHLLSHLSVSQATAMLNKAVSQGRLTMVDMGNDGKVANVTQIGHGGSLKVNEGFQ